MGRRPSLFAEGPGNVSASEKILSTNTIYEGRIVTLKDHQVELEDGRKSVREIVEHRGAVAMVPLTTEGEVLMIRQFRLATGGVLLELPAGTLDTGEEPRAAAAREIEEEIGMKSGELEELGSFFVSPGWCTERITVYLATGLTPSEQNLDEDEVVEVVSLPFEEAVAKCLDGTIRDAKSITGLLLASRRVQKERG
jgi:ADP-ribose pyrophosphatase